jgi:citrate synthase
MINIMKLDWIPATEAQRRLSVRPQTLYAYVSRGRVQMRPDPDDPRRSLYRAADVDALAARKARSRKLSDVAAGAIAWGEPVLPSAITTVSTGRLYYRGEDATRLAETLSLEAVAERLRGDLDGPVAPGDRPSPPEAADLRRRLYLALAERTARSTPLLGSGASSIAAEAAGVLQAMADAVCGTTAPGPIHARLARAWGCDPEGPGADLIRRMLVLVADHELNASTFAARVAASTGASLAAAVLAGLATLSGPRHGGASAAVRRLAEEADARGAVEAARARLVEGRHLPGFGHPLYPDGDIRAKALLARFETPAKWQALQTAAQELTGAQPNIDFALVAACDAFDLPEDAPFAVFAVARSAGWIAHAIEQSRGGLIRPRARYVGPPPSPA